MTLATLGVSTDEGSEELPGDSPELQTKAASLPGPPASRGLGLCQPCALSLAGA